MRTECLVCGSSRTRVHVKLRYLQVTPDACREAVEQEVKAADLVLNGMPYRQDFHMGYMAVSSSRLEDDLFKIAVEITNHTRLADAETLTRDEILPCSPVAAHTLLAVGDGDPPEHLRQAASECRNVVRAAATIKPHK